MWKPRSCHHLLLPLVCCQREDTACGTWDQMLTVQSCPPHPRSTSELGPWCRAVQWEGNGWLLCLNSTSTFHFWRHHPPFGIQSWDCMLVISLLNDTEPWVKFISPFFLLVKNHCDYVGWTYIHWPGSLTELENQQELAILRKKQKAEE